MGWLTRIVKQLGKVDIVANYYWQIIGYHHVHSNSMDEAEALWDYGLFLAASRDSQQAEELLKRALQIYQSRNVQYGVDKMLRMIDEAGIELEEN
jgi:hypothetical protein